MTRTGLIVGCAALLNTLPFWFSSETTHINFGDKVRRLPHDKSIPSRTSCLVDASGAIGNSLAVIFILNLSTEILSTAWPPSLPCLDAAPPWLLLSLWDSVSLPSGVWLGVWFPGT